jgi:hypothetical protein
MKTGCQKHCHTCHVRVARGRWRDVRPAAWAFAGAVSAIRHLQETYNDGEGTYYEFWPSPRPPRLVLANAFLLHR